MVLQNPPLTFLSATKGSHFDVSTHERRFESMPPKEGFEALTDDPCTRVFCTVYPALCHGEKVHKKASVVLYIPKAKGKKVKEEIPIGVSIDAHKKKSTKRRNTITSLFGCATGHE